MLWALELGDGKKPLDPALGVGGWIRDYCYEKGMILRNNGDILVIAPALVMTRQQIDEMLDLMEAAIVAATKHLGLGAGRKGKR